MKRISIVLSVLAAGCATNAPVPENLKPGANETLALIAPAKGVQIYECLDRTGKRIGSHYAGPHWESADGSKIVGAVKQRADAPGAGNIPWLLLGTKSVGSEGAFSKVTSIQRVATVGGVAPAGACLQSGTQARIAYTADYYFFTSN